MNPILASRPQVPGLTNCPVRIKNLLVERHLLLINYYGSLIFLIDFLSFLQDGLSSAFPTPADVRFCGHVDFHKLHSLFAY